MALFLVDPTLQLSIELPISITTEQALAAQLERQKDGNDGYGFGVRITNSIGKAILDALDWDLKEPTAAQVSYAMAIAKQLDIPLPHDALKYRGKMDEYLEAYSPILKLSQIVKRNQREK